MVFLRNLLYAQQNAESGFFHFYKWLDFERNWDFKVSMPCIGLLPFLPVLKVIIFMVSKRVNALHRASSISTNSYSSHCCYRSYVSMPCIGLLPFLRLLLAWIKYNLLCQCPASGFFHFYPDL